MSRTQRSEVLELPWWQDTKVPVTARELRLIQRLHRFESPTTHAPDGKGGRVEMFSSRHGQQRKGDKV
jgi:hypothetical protein